MNKGDLANLKKVFLISLQHYSILIKKLKLPYILLNNCGENSIFPYGCIIAYKKNVKSSVCWRQRLQEIYMNFTNDNLSILLGEFIKNSIKLLFKVINYKAVFY